MKPWNNGMLSYGEVAQNYSQEMIRSFKDLGYHTAVIGKNHFGSNKKLDSHSFEHLELYYSDYNKWFREEVTDGKNWFGVGLEPASKAVIGSQQVPYIFEDRVSQEEFISALEKIYNMSDEERDELGRAGMKHVRENYNFEKFCDSWVELMDSVHEKYGSWENRKHYQAWELREVQ